jgi:thiosulfate/3-mercaptopyruvate sulfurtransferase
MKREDFLIEADELMAKLGNDNLRIFDATITDDAYLQGHIPGATYFDHERFSETASPYTCTLPSESKLAKQIGDAGISNATEVVVYACGMLPYAVRAWWLLKYAGHENIRVLNGGISAWKAAGGQVEQQTRSYQPSIFTPNFTPKMFADKDEVLASLNRNDTIIVNVMPPASYNARRITGSINLSCMDLMQGFEYLLPNDQLAAQLGEAGKSRRIITYCGGGIAAAVNAMAHILTGHDNVAVYDGSLYEWLAEKLPTTGDGKWEIWQQA